jgi:hypothetical protein
LLPIFYFFYTFVGSGTRSRARLVAPTNNDDVVAPRAAADTPSSQQLYTPNPRLGGAEKQTCALDDLACIVNWRKDETNTIILTLVNQAFLDFMLNYAEHLNRIPLRNVVIIAQDAATVATLVEHNLPTFSPFFNSSLADEKYWAGKAQADGRESQ